MQNIFAKNNIQSSIAENKYSSFGSQQNVGVYTEKDNYISILISENPKNKSDLSKSFGEYFGSDFDTVRPIFEDFLENKIGRPATPQGYAGQNTLTISTKEIPKSTGSTYCYQSKQYKSGNWFVSEYEVPNDCVYDGGDGASCPRWKPQNPIKEFGQFLPTESYKYFFIFDLIIVLLIITATLGIFWFFRKKKVKII